MLLLVKDIEKLFIARWPIFQYEYSPLYGVLSLENLSSGKEHLESCRRKKRNLFLTILQYAARGARMLCRERFTDTHDSDAVANSGAFGKRCERQSIRDALGVYVA